MLPDVLTALAASGGAAIVAAAGTDVWTETRTAVARLFGRGGQQEEVVLRRLDGTATDLAQATDDQLTEQLRGQQVQSWRTRLQDLLLDLSETEREAAAAELRALVERVEQRGPSAGPGGLAVAGDVNITAEGGSMAAGIVHGGMHMGPTRPEATQG
ncbi:hypothetical protein [Streptomyces sp. NPDC013455]|uniref:hypothetical protein n=1 Tax=Streptomyces sp. NPDC013455 TaxID=3155605 RepID=UPI0033DFFD98